MALELGPQASLLFDLREIRHGSPHLNCVQHPGQDAPSRFRPSAGPATPQQEFRALVANAPNTSPGGGLVTVETQPIRAATQNPIGACAVARARPVPRGGGLGLPCKEVALGPRQPRDRTFTTAATKARCRSGAGVIGAALRPGGSRLVDPPSHHRAVASGIDALLRTGPVIGGLAYGLARGQVYLGPSGPLS